MPRLMLVPCMVVKACCRLVVGEAASSLIVALCQTGNAQLSLEKSWVSPPTAEQQLGSLKLWALAANEICAVLVCTGSCMM